MPVHVDESGRRSVTAEVELAEPLEVIWKAISTAEGISSWFVPTEIEPGEDGQPLRITSDFGPGMESVSEVPEWNPPHSFTAESRDFGEDAPPVSTTWSVEPRGKACIVRVEHAVLIESDEHDPSLEAWAAGWPDFFRMLELYVSHFSGQKASTFQLSEFAEPPRAAAWSRLFEGLGAGGLEEERPIRTSGKAPTLEGIVKFLGGPEYPEQLLLHLQSPAPGYAHIFALELEEKVLLSLRFYIFGESAEEIVKSEERAWLAWRMLSSSSGPPEEQSPS